MDNLRTDGYPRPQFARTHWQSLNGKWEFEFDDAEDGLARGLYRGDIPLQDEIVVPYAYQCAASGVNVLDHHEVVWYRRTFMLISELAGGRVLLNFNAVDYEATVWVNGFLACMHTGGYTAFSADITPFLKKGENVLVVRAIDRYDLEQPRGKQCWKKNPDRCWYHGTTGIWQNVWLEKTGEDYLERVSVQPDIDRNLIRCEAEVKYGKADILEVEISFRGEKVKTVRISLDGKITKFTVELMELDPVDELHYWTVEEPNLYDLSYRLFKGNEAIDTVEAYFGFRKIHRDEYGNIYLNNRPIYQRLILDQGYWAETDLTPPSPESLRADIEMSKQMGFNGARKHQKVEDPYFYYYADKLGFLVWGEMPSAYRFNVRETANITAQYIEVLKQLSDHPSVICFVPLNESWGVRKMLNSTEMQNFGRSMYYLTHALAPAHLVSTDDGWENLDENDILSVHDYACFGDDFPEKYRAENCAELYPMLRKLWAVGTEKKKLPMLMTEFGGVALKRDVKGEAWGYGGAEKDQSSFLVRMDSLFKGVYASDFVGYCYTQLTDVKQEVNGLLDENHRPKMPLEEIAKIVLRQGEKL